jgi:hypothetical protein
MLSSRGVFLPSQKLKDIPTKCTFWVNFVGKTLRSDKRNLAATQTDLLSGWWWNLAFPKQNCLWLLPWGCRPPPLFKYGPDDKTIILPVVLRKEGAKIVGLFFSVFSLPPGPCLRRRPWLDRTRLSTLGKLLPTYGRDCRPSENCCQHTAPGWRW